MYDTPLEREIALLREEVARLNGHRFVQIHGSTLRLLWFQLLRGLAFGLGSVVGATILVSVLVYTLSSIDFVPVVGEWAAKVIGVIEGARVVE